MCFLPRMAPIGAGSGGCRWSRPETDEDKLATSFDWMVKTYQQKYGEVYSECFCWYCESA